MANILLLRPYIKPSEVHVVIPNLGLGYLASALQKAGHSVDIIDGQKGEGKYEGFSKLIKKQKYDFVGMQLFLSDIISAKKYCEILKRESPSTICIFGGAYPSEAPTNILKDFPGVNFLIRGEGEIAFPKFIESFTNLEFQNVPNLVYRNGITTKIQNPKSAVVSGQEAGSRGQFSHHSPLITHHSPLAISLLPSVVPTNQQLTALNFLKEIDISDIPEQTIISNQTVPIDDLDSLEFPAWDLINPHKYPVSPGGLFVKSLPVAPMITSRGCPYNCAFCASHSIMGKKVRHRSVENVLDEMELLKYAYNINEIHFLDDNVSFKRDVIENICNGVLKRNFQLNFAAPIGIRLENIDAEIIKLMEKSGFYSIGIGIESGSQEILNSMNKNLDAKMIKEKISLIKKNTSIQLTGFFIIGFPGETDKDRKKTLTFSILLHLDRVVFNIFVPTPGSPIYHKLQDKSTIMRPDSPISLDFHTLSKIYDVSTARKLRLFRIKGYMRFYLRPQIFFKAIAGIKSIDQIKFLFRRLRKVVSI